MLARACLFFAALFLAAAVSRPAPAARMQQAPPGVVHVQPIPTVPPIRNVHPFPNRSLPACYGCALPQGYTLNPTYPGETCIRKRVECTCWTAGTGPVRSLQGLCLYPIVPLPKLR